MKRIIIALIALSSLGSCSTMKGVYSDLSKHCRADSEGTFKGSYRVCLQCDSLASTVKGIFKDQLERKREADPTK